MTHSSLQSLPKVLAGPIVRKVDAKSVTFWLVTSKAYDFEVLLRNGLNQELLFDNKVQPEYLSQVPVGKHAFVNLLTIEFSSPVKCGTSISYDINLCSEGEPSFSITSLMPDLVYPKQSLPNFVVKLDLRKVLHGSCRKPHHDSGDGLLVVDAQLEDAKLQQECGPDILILSGDQVYTDDVAGPMLVAIKQTIALLGLFNEELQGAAIDSSYKVFEHPHCYYQRPELLPDTPSSENTQKLFFGGKKKPIFTSVNANNHLISFAEVMAMYILTWSPEMWNQVDITDQDIPESFRSIFSAEKAIIENFVTGLPRVRRALANIPVYMIFDDHDITDDWNLTRGWEEAVYGNQFAKRIVGNALIGYWLCQGWGNDPKALNALYNKCEEHFSAGGIIEHDKLVEHVLDWERWHYHLDSSPKLLVLDTRTQRWRSESNMNKPSGLMDWEALCELQQELIGQKAVIMVSAAPIFGVKLIETIQRVFTFFGKALTVDAENWMAHKGTASVILNIFRNRKTPPNFVILSGDVHYSFVYDVTLRFKQNSPNITQITSSGIKNQFPDDLLLWFDRLNRVLYSKYSPLNWFTKRRNMLVKHRRPSNHKVRTLLNSSGIGMLKVDADCSKVEAHQLCASGELVTFEKKD
ncbi:alkaline phosphatase D family protein [Paraglaciecola sp. 2405UD69-4]|uniref:alkaline phosphatase D family protein n=1 Tax=Paraglaciecola sp. 2405UD69-4 TaxID=3391836 RepID=UPI0039C98E3B